MDEFVQYNIVAQQLAEAVANDPPIDQDGEPIESMLLKFVIVSEWTDTDGNKWLVRSGANGVGDEVPEWDIKGLLHEALFGEW